MTIEADSSVLAAKRDNEDALLSKSNVQSVGVGVKNDTDEQAVVVGVSEKVPESNLDANDIVPESVSGVRTDVVEVGEVYPQILVQEIDRKGTHRPIPQGVSIGHPEVTAGSTGWMWETDDGTLYIGSNNHVLANVNGATAGDPILQPGTADGGTTDDVIGSLEFFVRVEDGVSVDLALAKPDGVAIKNELAGVDKPITGTVESLGIGDELVKSGRTTGVTRGKVQQLDATVNVNYGDMGAVKMTGCIMTEAMSRGGDSGSSVAKEVDGELRAAGRLFAGSQSVTVHHHIGNEHTHLSSQFPSISLVTDGSGGGNGGGSEPPTAVAELELTKVGEDTGNIQARVKAKTEEGELLGPVDAATVTISGSASKTAETNADGIAVFEGVALGTYTVTVTKGGENDYLQDSVEITEGDFS